MTISRSFRPAPERASIYQDITQRIIAQLEAGTVPWVQPWKSAGASGLGMPTNARSGRAYSGINILILWNGAASNGFASNTWLTFRQALEFAPAGLLMAGGPGRINHRRRARAVFHENPKGSGRSAPSAH